MIKLNEYGSNNYVSLKFELRMASNMTVKIKKICISDANYNFTPFGTLLSVRKKDMQLKNQVGVNLSHCGY